MFHILFVELLFESCLPLPADNSLRLRYSSVDAAFCGPLEEIVCARHERDLMGCDSTELAEV